MALSHELISQFAKIVKDNKKRGVESTVYGVIVADGNGNKYVKLDGSDQLTPLNDDERPSADSTLVGAKAGERVSVLIKDHTATVTGNVSSPAVRTGDFNDLNDQVTDIKSFDIVIAERVQANEGYIQQLRTDKAEIGDLTAATARITELETKKASVEELNAAKAEITDLKATKIDVDVADAKYATIESLEATDAKFGSLDATYAKVTDLDAQKARIDTLDAEKLSADDADLKYATIGTLQVVQADVESLEADHANFKDATADNFTAVNASIDNLNTTKLTAESADVRYAKIDFANIDIVAVQKVFADSGIIKDLVVSEGKITGELVGVTIKGDIIEGGTVKADKLVVKGTDGLFYKLNTDGVTTTAEQTEYNSLSGTVITAKSITAEKVAVDDLVAFGATIGGFHITDRAIYSGAKESATNTTKGVYLDKDGQLSAGDSNYFIKYYKDQNGVYKLEISADSIQLGSSKKNVETAISEAKTAADSAQANVDSLETRVGTAETSISQNSEQIALRATKTELSEVKTAAENAQSDADNLKTRMTSAETSISQNSEAIELRATKTEVSTAKSEVISAAASDATSKANDALTDAKSYTDQLGTRVTDAETSITQNAEQIALRATSEEMDSTNATVSELQSALSLQADSISALVRNGESGSLIRQDTNGLYFFDISGLKKSISDNEDKIDGIENDQKKIETDISDLTAKTEYIAVGTDDNDKPYIELGEGDSAFKLKITNEQIQFIDGQEVPAYISNQKLMIEKAEVHNELRFGSFVWKERANGNMGLIWEEVTS